MFKVLCIDGGGSKGAISLGFLIEIEKKIGKQISQAFDLFVGTSAGSIIASSISLKDENGLPKFKSCQEILDVFISNVDKIFSRSWYHTFTTMGGLIGPKYDSQSEYKALLQIFGDTKINTDTIITSNIIDPTTRFFEFNSKIPVPIIDAIMASSAAPTYYGVHTIKYEGNSMDFIDGGISANNPSLSGFSEAVNRGYDAKDIFLVSVGTGYYNKAESNRLDEGGMLQWAAPISGSMMTTVSDYADYNLQKILHDGNYYRLNISIDSDKMDIVDKNELYRMVQKVSNSLVDNADLKMKFDQVCAKLV
jgi:uncharacterized protein